MLHFSPRSLTASAPTSSSTTVRPRTLRHTIHSRRIASATQSPHAQQHHSLEAVRRPHGLPLSPYPATHAPPANSVHKVLSLTALPLHGRPAVSQPGGDVPVGCGQRDPMVRGDRRVTGFEIAPKFALVGVPRATVGPPYAVPELSCSVLVPAVLHMKPLRYANAPPRPTRANPWLQP